MSIFCDFNLKEHLDKQVHMPAAYKKLHLGLFWCVQFLFPLFLFLWLGFVIKGDGGIQEKPHLLVFLFIGYVGLTLLIQRFRKITYLIMITVMTVFVIAMVTILTGILTVTGIAWLYDKIKKEDDEQKTISTKKTVEENIVQLPMPIANLEIEGLHNVCIVIDDQNENGELKVKVNADLLNKIKIDNHGENLIVKFEGDLMYAEIMQVELSLNEVPKKIKFEKTEGTIHIKKAKKEQNEFTVIAENNTNMQISGEVYSLNLKAKNNCNLAVFNDVPCSQSFPKYNVTLQNNCNFVSDWVPHMDLDLNNQSNIKINKSKETVLTNHQVNTDETSDVSYLH